jgi:type I restriction enzyme S subunit
MRTGWKMMPLSEAYWFQEGPGVRNTQFRDTGIKLLNVGNIRKNGVLDLAKTDRHLDPEEVELKYSHFLADEGDLVIASSGVPFDSDGLLRTRGAFVYQDHLPLCLNTSTIRFKAKEGISDLRFLRLWLNTREFRTQITRFVTGTAQQNFGPSHLKITQITLPPLAEQRRIAAILDQAEALRAKRRHALAQLDTFTQSLFLDLFGHPIQNNKGWLTAELGSVAQVERGKFTPRPRNDPSYYGGTFPFIQTGDISSSKGRVNSWIQTLNEKGIAVSRSFPPGTVVIAIVGATLGITAILDVEVYCPDSVVGIQVHPEKASSEYIERVLRFWRPVFVTQAPETARANINLETLRPLKIPIPPVNVQREFSTQVAAVERLKASQRASLAKLDALFASLQHRAFCGEL